VSDLTKDLQAEEVRQYRYAALVALMIEYAWPRRAEGVAALADTRRTVARRHPWAKGIRLRRGERSAIGSVLVENSESLQTARQVSSIELMDEDAVLLLARQCMRAQNRRAKHHRRDRVVVWDGDEAYMGRSAIVEQVYTLKKRFLMAWVEHDQALRVEHFTRRRVRGWECFNCERSWGGGEHADECYSCGDSGSPILATEDWFIVDLEGGYRFHQPGNELPEAGLSRYLSIAVEVEAHDPDQPLREVPYLGLTDAAQRHCIERAIIALTRRAARRHAATA